MKKLRISIIGAGAWGQALAYTFCQNSHETLLWDKNPHAHLHPCFDNIPNKPKIQKKSQHLFPADILVFVTPSHTAISALENILPYYQEQKAKPAIIIASKGFSPHATDSLFLSENFEKKLFPNALGILSGPSFASEVFDKKPTYVSLATKNQSWGLQAIHELTLPHFDFKLSKDVIGTQISGAMKNLYAIGSGYLKRAEVGDNCIAKYLTLSIEELKDIILSYKASVETLLEPAGIGDLLLTCSSTQSRNFAFGYHLDQENKDKNESLKEGTKLLHALQHIKHTHKLELPIATVICDFLNKKISHNEIIKKITFKSSSNAKAA